MYHQLETTTSCDDMVNTINSMVVEYETGIVHQLRDHHPNHQHDHLVDNLAGSTTPTTPTTSQTTTPTATTDVTTTPTTTTTITTVTTTPTTIPTNTGFKAAVACTSSPESLHSLTSCTALVAVLNTILGLYQTATGTISCDSTAIPGTDLLTDAALTAAIREFRGPAGAEPAIACGFGASFVDTAECTGAATALNEMADVYVGGGYQGCEATISTTTVTTSVNTSPIVAAL